MKDVILLICFGNKNINIQIEKLRQNINKNFKAYDIYICFTSSFFINKYGYSIQEILGKICSYGYKNIICLPIFTIDGIEYEKAIKCIKKYENQFDKIAIAKPLLYDDDDFNIIYNYIKNNKDENVLYICHGTEDKANEKYKKLFNMFKNQNIFFANLESQPYIEDVLKILVKKQIKQIYLKPFLLFKGKHIQKDIAQNIKNKLQQKDINVSLNLTPLLQQQQIIDLFIKHLKKEALKFNDK